MDLSWKFLLGVNLLFLIILGGLFILLTGLDQRMDYLNEDTWTLTIQKEDTSEIQFLVQNLTEFPYIERDYFLFRGGGDKQDENGLFRGISLKYLISNVANESSYNSVQIRAIDGYGMTMTFQEINETEDIIIAYMKDGNFIQGSKNGDDGPLRLIVPQRFEGDTNALRCVKYVNNIIIG